MNAIIAFHTTIPAKDGGAIRSLKLHDALRLRVDHEFYARDRILNSSGSTVADIHPPSISRPLAAVRTLLRRRHYVLERHVGRDARHKLRSNAARYSYVYANFIWAAALVDQNKLKYVDTHNSEGQWFTNLAERSRSPLTKLVCSLSLSYSIRLLKCLPDGVCMIHVSPSDAEWYAKIRPDLRHVVIPNGCDLRPRDSFEHISGALPGKRKAYFLGSLGVSMNYDALQYFSTHFWPTLRDCVEFTVIGSNPSQGIVALCQKYGWSLHANVSDAELDALLAPMEFAYLPFERSAGSKLKFYDALGRGMYVLTTSSAASGMGPLPETVCISNIAAEWAKVMRETPQLDMNRADVSLNYAARYTWRGLYVDFLNQDTGPLGHDFRR